MLKTLKDLFDGLLPPAIGVAQAVADGATDWFAFTSCINERFEMPQKLGHSDDFKAGAVDELLCRAVCRGTPTTIWAGCDPPPFVWRY